MSNSNNSVLNTKVRSLRGLGTGSTKGDALISEQLILIKHFKKDRKLQTKRASGLILLIFYWKGRLPDIFK